MDRLLMTKTER